MKKILSVLLAICMMVGMVTVLASADTAKKAHYKLPMASTAAAGATQASYDMIEGDADRFYKTNANGFVVTDGASASDYNIKVTFKAGEPLTVYLKGANINVPRAIGTAANAAMEFGKEANSPADQIMDFAVKIVVETDSNLKNSWATYEEGNAGSCTHGRSPIQSYAREGLTITGPGKLDVWSDCISPISAYGKLTFKDANVKAELNIPYNWGTYFTVWAGRIEFDNSKADLVNNYNGVIKAAEENGTLVIKNGSDVKAVTNSTGSWGEPMLVATGGITVDTSKLLAYAEGEGMYSVGKQTVTMNGVNALGGTKEANAKEFSEKKQSAYTYVIAGPDVVIPTEAPTTATTASKATSATKATTATKATGATTGSQATGDATGTNNDGNTATQGGNDATTGTTNPTDNNTTAEEKGGLTWLYILLGVVILAGAAAVVLFIIKKDAAVGDEEAEEEEETEAVEETETTEDAE